MRTVSTNRSEKLSELLWVNVRDLSFLCVNNVLSAWLDWNALNVDLGTFSLSFLLLGFVGVDSLDEGLSGLGLTDVLNSDVDAFGDNAGVDALVDDNTNGVGGDIKDSTSLSVVELVGHTTVGRSVSNDVDVISLLVDSEDRKSTRLNSSHR